MDVLSFVAVVVRLDNSGPRYRRRVASKYQSRDILMGIVYSSVRNNFIAGRPRAGSGTLTALHGC